MEAEHVPVLLDETVEALKVRPDGIYVDATLGGGGYSKKLISILTSGEVIAIDQDPKAVAAAREFFAGVPNIRIVHGNFRDLGEILDAQGVERIDGAVFDLGISSMQLARPEMGISFQHDGPLDMRFDPGGGGQSAADLLSDLSENELREMFSLYGERFAGRIARRVVEWRATERIDTVGKLNRLVAKSVPKRPSGKNPATKVFLALRCEVNRELEALAEVLPVAIERTKPGGRIAVVTYHSLEDRITRDRFRRAERGCECELPAETCGCPPRPMAKQVNKKGTCPTDSEVEGNRRARSGKLRVAERI